MDSSIEEEYKEKIDAAREELDVEQKKWEEVGLAHPSISYTPDLFFLANAFNALKNLLVEKGIITDLELTLIHTKMMVENMKALRKEAEPILEEQRRNAIIARNMPPDNGQFRLPFEN